MEKRVLLAAILSALLISWYSEFFLKPAVPVKSTSSQIAPQAKATEPRGITYHIEQEDVTSIYSEDVEVRIGQKTGQIREVMLKRFSDQSTRQPLRIAADVPLLSIKVGVGDTSWRQEFSDNRSARFSQTKNGINYNISYSFQKYNHKLSIELTSDSAKQETVHIFSAWRRADALNGKTNVLELTTFGLEKSGKPSYKRDQWPIKAERNVPRGTAILALTERYFCHVIKPIDAILAVTLLPSVNNTISAESSTTFTGRLALSVFFGPRDYFYLKRENLQEAFPIGALGKIGLILLAVLTWIAGITKSYGVGIILLAGLITSLTAPFTLISMKSMKKMQELKPAIDGIMAQHNANPAEANKAVFQLYREHKVSPLSGCLPMLLQMPIFIALFQAISHFIELRGKSFLWIDDLSLPDRLAVFPFSLPILGNSFNLLPLIMAATMYVQSKTTQSSMGQTGQTNPTAKLMSGPLMSIIFGIMFYQFPAGLVLYWLTNSLMTLAWYRVAK